MADELELWEKPEAEEMYMLVGWRQWADGGSVSSGLPAYLVEHLNASPIGRLRPDGFYLFQIPGTHDLVRPVVEFQEGFPQSLQTPRNEFYYSGDTARGLVIFLGDEPHMDAERYVAALIQAAQTLGVKRIIGFGGVYGELPYDKERMVSAIYSLPELKEQLADLAVNLSNYHGGASIGSFTCRRAGEQQLEFVGLYAFVPTYDFSDIAEMGNTIRIENDYFAWLGVMRRVNYLLGLGLDLTDLETKSARLIEVVEKKINELDKSAPEAGVRAYLERISENFEETPFNPINEVWEEELRRLLGKFDDPAT
jgi:proteasome assembly chaperone (PAC2) family protein